MPHKVQELEEAQSFHASKDRSKRLAGFRALTKNSVFWFVVLFFVVIVFCFGGPGGGFGAPGGGFGGFQVSSKNSGNPLLRLLT